MIKWFVFLTLMRVGQCFTMGENIFEYRNGHGVHFRTTRGAY